MRLGVVIPAHNAELYIEETLLSVVRQSVVEWSCVVVDDGSTDNTSQVVARVAEFDGRFHLVRQKQLGVSTARNRGAAMLAPCDAIVFLDADDLLTPNAFLRHRQALLRNPTAAASTGAVLLINEVGVEIGQAPTPQPGLITLRQVFHQNPCPTASGYAFRTTAYVDAGGFQSVFWYGEDWLMAILASRRGGVVVTDDAVVRYRRHSGSVTSSDEANSRGHTALRDVRRFAYFDPSNTSAERRAMRGGWRAHHLQRAREAGRRGDRATRYKHLVAVVVGRPAGRLHMNKVRGAGLEGISA